MAIMAVWLEMLRIGSRLAFAAMLVAAAFRARIY